MCLGPALEDAVLQAKTARDSGCAAVVVAPGSDDIDGCLPIDALSDIDGVDAVASFADEGYLRKISIVLAERDGKIIPCLSELDLGNWCRIERHLCVDTTAAGGNASLLAAAET